jgi:L-ascorbate metabolism protein UlaG (beta-lactamase superfamily)
LDQHTIDELAKLHPECKFYVPLGNKSWFNLDKKKDSHGNDRVIEKDWWDSSILKRYQSDGKSVAAELKVTCTPCQHFTGRGIFDRNKTLWASWCVEGWIDGQVSKGKVFFGG